MLQLIRTSRECLIPPLPSGHPVLADLERQLSYTHKKYIRGAEARTRLGKSHGFIFSQRTFLRPNPDGSLVTNAGFANRVYHTLVRYGFQVQLFNHGLTTVQPDWGNLTNRIGFRALQQEALQLLISDYFGGIQASPGFGKSFLIRVLCHLFPTAQIDVTADSVNVAWNICDYLSPHMNDVGMVGDGQHNQQRVTIYVADSLHHSTGDADILIGDEVHTLVTEMTVQKFAKYHKARRYWFSASPEGRLDGADMRVEGVFGPSLLVVPYQVCVQNKLIVNLTVKWIRVDMPYNPIGDTTDTTARSRWGIWRNNFRNEFLANAALSEVDPDDQVLVLVSKMEHLCHMLPYLPGFLPVFGHSDNTLEEGKKWAKAGKIDPVHFDHRRRRNQEMRHAFARGEIKRIIVTNVWDTGVDFPQLAVMLRADPEDSSEIKDIQAPGRASRRVDGKESAVLYYPVDTFDKRLQNRAKSSRTRFLREGWDEENWPDLPD